MKLTHQLARTLVVANAPALRFAARVVLIGSVFWALSTGVAGCGSSNERAKVATTIPEQPDAGDAARKGTARDNVVGEPDAGAAAAPKTTTGIARTQTMPAGANGPRDAAGMIGAGAGAAVTGSPEMTAFVNTAEIRAHPKGPEFGPPLVASLVGWNEFMPHDLVHPLRETNWVLMAGSLFLGSTQKNVILASHTLDEKRSDAVFAELLKRLPNSKRVDLKVGAGVKALEATVDRGERAYVRPKPAVLAIVPKDDGKRVADLVRRAEVSPSLRKGELVRIAFDRLPRQLSSTGVIPAAIVRRIGSSRIWVEADGPNGANLTLNGEADFKDDEEASRAAEQIRAALDGVRGLEAAVARSLLRGAAVWPDGKLVRYRADLDDGILAMFSMAVCGGEPACGIPP